MPQEEMDQIPGNSHHSGKGGNGTNKTVKRVNWKKAAQKLEEELEAAKLRYQELTRELAEAKEHAPALAEREAIKLRRFQGIVAQMTNAPFCDHCRGWYDKMHEREIKYMRETIDESRKAVGG